MKHFDKAIKKLLQKKIKQMKIDLNWKDEKIVFKFSKKDTVVYLCHYEA